MFVASVDRSDPNKNTIFKISPSGQFLGAFVQMTDGLASTKFNINPTAHGHTRSGGPGVPSAV